MAHFHGFEGGGSFGHHVGCVVFVFPWRPTYLCGFLLAVLIIEATCSVHHVTGYGYNRVGGLGRNLLMSPTNTMMAMGVIMTGRFRPGKQKGGNKERRGKKILREPKKSI
jgi:glycerol-3-phosphate acyltransferase PlsY